MHKLGLVGGGVMGEAILTCLLTQKVYCPEDIIVSDPQASRRADLVQKYGVAVSDRNFSVFDSEVVLLAIKPQIFAAIAQELVTEGCASSGLVISILAGVTLAQLEAAFVNSPVVRAMPNTPAQVGAGMTAIALGKLVTPTQKVLAQNIFAAVGEVVEVPESLINAVTGLSGSGPGYVAVIIEALADGGVASGLPRAIAMQLAVQTVLGTAQLIAKTGLHPAQLKDQVTSPGGTTIAGIAQLEKSGVRSGIIEAVKAATRRAEELGS